jgi:hypothetical protein
MHFLAKVYRVYTVLKSATIAIIKITFGLAICGSAAALFHIASYFISFDQFDTPSVVVGCIGLTIGGYGLMKIFEALPGITPPRTSDAPGRSRLASRRDLRRSGIL